MASRASQPAPASAHREVLANRHAALEKELHDEQSRPAPDALRLQDLKKRKLTLKQEIDAL